MSTGILKKIAMVLVFMLIISSGHFLNGELVSFANEATDLDRISNAIVLYVEDSNALVNNVRVKIEEENHNIVPIIKNNRTLVPLRFIVESLGAEIEWEQATRRITIGLDNKSVELQIGNKVMKNNGTEVVLDTEPIIMHDRTFVPVRAVSEAFGKEVFYDRKLIIISDIEKIYNPQTDKFHIDNIISKVVYNTTLKELSTQEISKFDESVVMIEVVDEFNNSVGGSGFYIGKGLFLTNYHVVEGMVSGHILTNNQEEFEIEGIVKFNQDSDLAIIKTKKPVELLPLKIGSMNSVSKGDRVIAIGSPEGLQNTVSDGIISGFRKMNDVDLIQITAPITYGSSGGPLFNIYGEVIGVNTQGFDSGNLNFAVAIDHAKAWLNELKNIAFSQIKILSMDKIIDSSVTDDEVINVIKANLKAMIDKDIEAYMDTVYLPSAADQAEMRAALAILFQFDFEVEVTDYKVLEKSANKARIQVNQVTRQRDSYLIISTSSRTIHTVTKINNKWKISETQVIERTTTFTDAIREPKKIPISINNIYVNSVTETTAEISFTTNNPAISKIEYGTNNRYDKTLNVSTAAAKEHSIILKNLTAGTQYNYRIYYKEADGDFQVTTGFTFTTKTTANSNAVDLSNIVLDSINLTSPLDKIVYNADLNKGFGIDAANKKLVIIDLKAKVIEREVRLTYKPSDLVVVNDKDRIFIVNEGSSFITEMKLSDFSLVKNIPWEAPHIDRYHHFHIKYLDNKLYIVDGSWEPGLWRIDLTSYKVEDLTTQVSKIGDLVFSSNGNQLFYWHQYGWDAGWAGSNIYKYAVSGSGFSLIDQTDIGYPKMSRDPLDAPILLLENKNLIIAKKYVLNMNNLKQIYYTFSEEIYAVDPQHRYVVGKENIYDLEYYDVLIATPKQNADQYYFDKDGNLHMLVNSEKKLYIGTVK